jgi:hypothetical protein
MGPACAADPVIVTTANIEHAIVEAVTNMWMVFIIHSDSNVPHPADGVRCGEVDYKIIHSPLESMVDAWALRGPCRQRLVIDQSQE